MPSESVMQSHVTSMLKYLADNSDFVEMIGGDSKVYPELIQRVTEDSLWIYGFVAHCDKEQLSDLGKSDGVSYVTIKPCR